MLITFFGLLLNLIFDFVLLRRHFCPPANFATFSFNKVSWVGASCMVLFYKHIPNIIHFLVLPVVAKNLSQTSYEYDQI